MAYAKTVISPEEPKTQTLGTRTKFMTLFAVSKPKRLSFLGTSFKDMEKVLLCLLDTKDFPIRLEKEKHIECVRWALQASGEAYEPWQQIHDYLDLHEIIEVHIAD